MTPAERLRAAADRLEALGKAATPGPWTTFEQHGADITGEGWSYIGVNAPSPDKDDARPLVVAECLDSLDRVENPQADAALIATLRPLAPVLARQLREAADEYAATVMTFRSGSQRHMRQGCTMFVATGQEPECAHFDDAFAIADAVLGGAS